MGNAVTKKYDVPREHSATAGHCSLFKIWPGKKKESGEEVSVWAFDKADLLKRKQSISDRTAQEQIFQLMRKDFTTLKDCSCGGLISVIEVIEESKNAIVFTTERIICSLADVLSRFETVPSGATHADFFENGRVVSEIEVSRGFLNLAEGLQYLHIVQRKLHLGINPESVVITAEGVWKLCSLGLSLGFQQGEQLKLPSPYFLKAEPTTHTSSIRLEPDLRYSGPELTAGGFNPPGIRYLTPASDIFSLGILAYEVYRFNLQTSGHHSPIIGVTSNAVNFHIAALDSLSILDFAFLPPSLTTLLRSMISLDYTARPNASDVANNPFFVTGSLATMRMIDTLGSRDVGTQSSQLIALPSQLSSFPPRVLQGTILPVIFKLCTQNPSLWVYALATHIHMSQHLPLNTYTHLAGAYVAQGLAVTSPVEVMQTFLKNISWVVATFDSAFVEQHVATLYCNALEKPNSNIQAKAFEILADEKVRKGLSKATLHDKLIPRTCKEACKNPDPNVKIYALYFLSLVCGRLDRDFIIKNILPSLKFITDNEKNPIVSMCVIGDFEVLCDIVGPEYIASAILPTIQPMLIDRSLNKQQFALVVNLSRIMLRKVVDMRTSEMGMPDINFSVEPSEQGLDAFASAKAMFYASNRSQTEGDAATASTAASSTTALPTSTYPYPGYPTPASTSNASSSSGSLLTSAFAAKPYPTPSVSTPSTSTTPYSDKPPMTPTPTSSYPAPYSDTPSKSTSTLSPPPPSAPAFKLSPPPPPVPSPSPSLPTPVPSFSSFPTTLPSHPPPPPPAPVTAPTAAASSTLPSAPSQQRGSSLRSVKASDKGTKRGNASSSSGSSDLLDDFSTGILSASASPPAISAPSTTAAASIPNTFASTTGTGNYLPAAQWPSSSSSAYSSTTIPSPSSSSSKDHPDMNDFLTSFGKTASISSPAIQQYQQQQLYQSSQQQCNNGNRIAGGDMSSYGGAGIHQPSGSVTMQPQFMGLQHSSGSSNMGIGNNMGGTVSTTSGLNTGSSIYGAQMQVPNQYQQTMYAQPQQQQQPPQILGMGYNGYQQPQQHQIQQQGQPQQHQYPPSTYGYPSTNNGGVLGGQQHQANQQQQMMMGITYGGGIPPVMGLTQAHTPQYTASNNISMGFPQNSTAVSGLAGAPPPPSDHDPFAFLH